MHYHPGLLLEVQTSPKELCNMRMLQQRALVELFGPDLAKGQSTLINTSLGRPYFSVIAASKLFVECADAHLRPVKEAAMGDSQGPPNSP